MSETYIEYDLVTPVGILQFNHTPGSSGYWLNDVQGLDGATTRHAEYNLPQRDGGVVLDVLVGPAYVTFVGEIRLGGTDTLTERLTLMDNLSSYLDSIRKQDGTLSWTPTGQSDTRSLTVRLAEAVQITNPGGILKDFQVQLMAANPYQLATTEQSASIPAFSTVGGALVFPMVQNAGGAFPFTFGTTKNSTVVVTPGGNSLAWPTIAITGPVTAPVITNLTTGYYVSLPNLILDTGVTLTVDMWNEQVYVGDTSNSFIGYVDFANSDFWALLPNTAQTIQVAGDGATDNPSATISYSNTYI